jgi:phage gpG-like protein
MANSFKDLENSFTDFTQSSFSAKLKVESPDLRRKGNLEKGYRTALVKALSSSTRKVESQVKQAMDANMRDAIWAWPRTTERKAGGVAGSPRDIIDTGNLISRNYIRIGYTTRGASITVGNNSPYAGIVHFGGYITPYGDRSKRAVFAPGRPWIGVAIGTTTVSSGGTTVDWRAEIQQALVKEMQDAKFG